MATNGPARRRATDTKAGGRLERSFVRRGVRIALPFLFVAAGAAVFYLSPWPAIIHLALKGARVRVAWNRWTLGQPMVAMACWAAAIWLSLRVRADR